jgi:MFS family permease
LIARASAVVPSDSWTLRSTLALALLCSVQFMLILDLTTTFREGSARNRALGVWGAVAAAGGAVGLLLSGIITDVLGWSWVFFLNVPIAAVAIGLSPFLLPESQAPDAAPRLDVAGAVSVTLGSLLLIFGLSQAAPAGVLSARTLVRTVGGGPSARRGFRIDQHVLSGGQRSRPGGADLDRCRCLCARRLRW